MTSEREVRTRAGWIGVEISKSRVRRADRPGYGLWRVRGSVGFLNTYNPSTGQTRGFTVGEWTGYLFTLEEIERAVQAAIDLGTPAGPYELHLSDGSTGRVVVTHRVPTRWTSRYRGRRDLGVDAQ